VVLALTLLLLLEDGPALSFVKRLFVGLPLKPLSGIESLGVVLKEPPNGGVADEDDGGGGTCRSALEDDEARRFAALGVAEVKN
jgi:hypothetical protein